LAASLALGALAHPCFADKRLDDAVAKAGEQVQKGKSDEAMKGLEKFASASASGEAWAALGSLQARLGERDGAALSFTKARELSASAPAPARAQVLAAVASFQLDSASGKDALATAQAAVEAHGSAEALAILARAQVRANDTAAGLKSAERAIAAGGAPGAALEAKGLAQAAMGSHAEAVAAYTDALKADPKRTRARAGLALALAAKGDVKQAVAEARKATEDDPKSGEAFAVLGRALLAENPKSWNDAIAQAQQGAFLEPKSPMVQSEVGRIFQAAGNLDQAVAAFRKALETDPGYTPARLALVEIQLQKGDNKGALAEARKLAEEAPGSGDAQLALGRELLRARDYTAALPILQKAAAALPGIAEAHALLGTSAFFEGKNDVAVAAYKRALELKPDNVQWRTDYGLLLGRNGDAEAGAAELKKVIASPGYKDAAGFVNLGYVYRNAKPPRLDESIQAYHRALEIDPKEQQAALGLAWSYLTARRYDESIAAYEKVIALDPKLAPDGYNGMGWAWFFKEDMARAKDAAAKAKAAGRLDARLVDQIQSFEKARAAGEAAKKKALDDALKARESGSRVDAIAEGLRSKDAATRSRAARELGAAGGADTVSTLVWVLANDKEYGVRASAAAALGAIGAAAESAAPYLKQCASPCMFQTVLTPAEMAEEAQCQDMRSACQQALARVRK
jgi:tetratricopeptide (TPR) repeat protein